MPTILAPAAKPEPTRTNRLVEMASTVARYVLWAILSVIAVTSLIAVVR